MTTSTSNLRSVPSTTSVPEILAIVSEDGGVIIEQFLSPEQIASFNSEIQTAMNELDPGSTNDDEFIVEFHGSNTKRLTNLVTRSETFRNDVIDRDLVHALSDAIFVEQSGTYQMNSAQVIEIGPGNKAQMLHRDLENWYPFIGMGPAGPEIMINFLIAFTDFTEEIGATRVIPKSNHWDDFADRGTDDMTMPAVMKAGDVLFMSGKTSHGGGANVTDDQFRRAVAFSLCAGFLNSEEAFPFMIDLELAKTLSPRVQRLIGFRSQFPTGSAGLQLVDYSELSEHLGLD